MANSKANIYPIQLQNAELNLNKYDAEIKQYSGFNKNNAPFVGGCLSNIFTKNETISNANKDNVFIDDEGNVYTTGYMGFGVDQWYLYKNNEFVNSGSEKQFFVNNKIDLPDNTVKIVNDDLFVNELNQIDYYDYRIRSRTGIKFKNISSGNKLESISLIRYSGSNRDLFAQNSITRIFVSPDGEKNFCIISGIVHGIFNIIGIDLDPITDGDDQVYRYFFYNEYCSYSISLDEPLAICWDETGTQQFSFFFAQNGNEFKFAEFFTIDFTGGTVSKVDTSVYTSISTSILTTGEKLVPESLIAWHILSYPENKAILMRQISSASAFNVTDQTGFKIVGRLQTPYIDNGNVKFRSKTTINYPEVKTVATSYFIKIGEYIESRDSTHTPWICSCDIQNAVSETYDDGNLSNFKTWITHQCNNDYALNGFNFTDYNDQRNLDVIKRGKYALGDFAPIGKGLFYFALNNNLLSAICSKYVLLTEWNSIEPEKVEFYNDYRASKKILGNFDERIYYKCGSEWFEIRLVDKPSLRVFGNQIVVNVNSVTNSYDYKRNKVLHFATPFNSIVDGWHRKSADLYSLYSQGNDYYVAGVIRAYEQENNSSIILNPVNIAVQAGGQYRYAKRFYANCFNEYVDIYSNVVTGNSVIEYNYSVLWTGTTDYFNIDAEKYGFSYPIDTNGNVEYNVNLFSVIESTFGNAALIKSQLNSYPLVVGNNNNILMNYYLASGIEGLTHLFVIQGSFFGILNDYICSLNYNSGVVSGIQFIVSVKGLQFCGNSPYEALFYSETNRCLYSFVGANVLQQKQLVDKISRVKMFNYNPSTQSLILLTDIGVLISSLFGVYMIDMPEAENLFLLKNGLVLTDNTGVYRYIKYYKKDTDDDYLKENIKLETCFYGMNNQTVTINDCLYMRLFSEEHEEGNIEISASTLSLKGRKTEKTTFKIKASDWDEMTHTIYLRYQPKEQRGLGISFAIESPFKIASMSVGSQADAILVDKVSKGAINAPFNNTSSTIEW